jgi:hypothetical protein
MTPVTTLKAQWQAARQLRQQAIVHRRQQTRDELNCWQRQRLDESAQQRCLLQQQHLSQRLEVALCLDQLQHNRHLQAQQLHQALLDDRRELEATVSDLRLRLLQDLQPIQQQAADWRRQSQTRQALLRSQLLPKLKASRIELQQSVTAALNTLTAARLAAQVPRQHQRQQGRQALAANVADFRQACRRSAAALKLQIWGQPAATEPLTTDGAAEAPTVLIVPAQLVPAATQPPAAKAAAAGLAAADDLPALAQPQAAVLEPAAPLPVTAPTAPEPTLLEEALYIFLHQRQGARLQEIEASLEISRFQAVDTLRSLIQKQLVSQTDRTYHVQEEAVL